jgi:hypothetical protein
MRFAFEAAAWRDKVSAHLGPAHIAISPKIPMKSHQPPTVLPNRKIWPSKAQGSSLGHTNPGRSQADTLKDGQSAVWADQSMRLGRDGSLVRSCAYSTHIALFFVKHNAKRILLENYSYNNMQPINATAPHYALVK